MDKISRSICEKFSDVKNRKSSPTAPIGSTQNVGSSVKGGRWPTEYDSSPMLLFQMTWSARENAKKVVHKAYNWKVGYWVFKSFLTNSSTRTSYSVTKSTEFFFSITSESLEEADWMATDPSMIITPALRARLIVKERIALRSAGVSFELEVDMVYRFPIIDFRFSTLLFI